MPFPDYLTLDRHWGRFPPEHVALRGILGALGAGPAKGRPAPARIGKSGPQLMAEIARAMGRAS